MVAMVAEGALRLLPNFADGFSRSAAPRPIAAFLDAHPGFDRPTLVMDLDAVAARYRDLAAGLGDARIHYAVKANPAPEILRRLVREGCCFDAASRGEIALCLDAGARPEAISFGNTIKRASDIAWAWERGIRLFAVDAAEELGKIAENAPGAQVMLRILLEESPGDWPLSRKFGCAPESAGALMRMAQAFGLEPVGISFHVGSQTREAAMWRPGLERMGALWRDLLAEGFALSVVNIGGGFPASYDREVAAAATYAAEVRALVAEAFGPVPVLMAEPGRGMVAEAGVIAAEVLLVDRKRTTDIARWVYLDIGRFSGLAETMDEAIRYRIETSADGGETGACVLAGPSCDSVDVLYETRPVQLPLALKAGDKVRILGAGAYTASYSSIGFNGFPPLGVICL